MIYITSVHMVGGSQHEHIANVRWINSDGTNSGENTRQSMVDWIKNKGGDARVRDGQGSVQVGVVNATPPYIQTHADGRWTDNLLSLPKY